MTVWDSDDSDDSGEWLRIDDCAARMGVTPERVRELIRRRVLRTRHDRDYVVTLVQPAILSGFTG